jgi:hypothetical protein
MIKVFVQRYHLYEKNLVLILAFCVGCAAIAYAYFLSLSVLAVIERNHAEREIDRLKGRLAEQERMYVDLGQRITLDLAMTKGFTEVKEPR